MRGCVLFAIALGLGGVIAFGDQDRAFEGEKDQPGIEYSKRPVRDQVAELNRRIEQGKVSPSVATVAKIDRALKEAEEEETE